jgi:RNA polymerase-binding transcription factor DksA
MAPAKKSKPAKAAKRTKKAAKANPAGAKAEKAATAGKTSAAKKATKRQVSKQQGKQKKSTGRAAKKSTARAVGTSAKGPAATPTIPPEADYLRDEAWLAKQREALLRERANYTNSADRLAAEAAALMADREPGDVQFDEESGEGDTIAVERDRDLALSAAARQAVADIDRALARLDNSTYGLCVAGGDAIPKERLEAIPEAAVCVEHKTSMF